MSTADRDEEIALLRAELTVARSRLDTLNAILVGVHELLPAEDMQFDGKTYQFSFGESSSQAILRLLSARIRAIPEKLKAL